MLARHPHMAPFSGWALIVVFGIVLLSKISIQVNLGVEATFNKFNVSFTHSSVYTLYECVTT